MLLLAAAVGITVSQRRVLPPPPSSPGPAEPQTPAVEAAPTPAPIAEAAPGSEAEAIPMASAPPAPNETIKGLLGEDLESAQPGDAYSSSGRRDPFVALARPVSRPKPSVKPVRQVRPKGPPGFSVEELNLRGIVRTTDGFLALVQGPDGKSYPMGVGQRLFDGEIIALDGATMTLRQDHIDQSGHPRATLVKKSLYPHQ